MDQLLGQWVASQLGEVDVLFSFPQREPDGAQVSIYLLEALKSNTPRPARGRPPLQIILRYLITAWAKEPEEMHRLFSTLFLAAVDDEKWELESESIPLALWQTLGVPVRPALVLRVPVTRDRPEKDVPYVTREISLKTGPMRRLRGRLLGPNGVALMNALVEAPALNLATRTNADGDFLFQGVPVSGFKGLRVNARGRAINLSPKLPKDDELLIIKLERKDI